MKPSAMAAPVLAIIDPATPIPSNLIRYFCFGQRFDVDCILLKVSTSLGSNPSEKINLSRFARVPRRLRGHAQRQRRAIREQ